MSKKGASLRQAKGNLGGLMKAAPSVPPLSRLLAFHLLFQSSLNSSFANPSLTGYSLSRYTRGVVTRFLGKVLTSMPVCC